MKMIKTVGAVDVDVKSAVDKFLKFIEKNYEIKHEISFCLPKVPFLSVNEEGFLFSSLNIYRDYLLIVVACNIDFYIRECEMDREESIEYVLVNFAHEIIHYFQFRDSEPFIEDGVDDIAEEMVSDFLNG